MWQHLPCTRLCGCEGVARGGSLLLQLGDARLEARHAGGLLLQRLRCARHLGYHSLKKKPTGSVTN